MLPSHEHVALSKTTSKPLGEVYLLRRISSGAQRDFGFAAPVADIGPPTGGRRWGYYRRRRQTKIHMARIGACKRNRTKNTRPGFNVAQDSTGAIEMLSICPCVGRNRRSPRSLRREKCPPCRCSSSPPSAYTFAIGTRWRCGAPCRHARWRNGTMPLGAHGPSCGECLQGCSLDGRASGSCCGIRCSASASDEDGRVRKDGREGVCSCCASAFEGASASAFEGGRHGR